MKALQDVIVIVLIIVLCTTVPSELYGTWYESEGYGTINFYPNGEIKITVLGSEYEGSYTFNSATDEGTITYDAGESAFTCDGTTLEWEGSTWTETYVEQIEFDWNSMFGGLYD